MEYCHDGSLGSFLKQHALREDELRDVVASCLLGLRSLHIRNIIHQVVVAAFTNHVGHKAQQSSSFGGRRRED